ncbi:urotensin-2 receptor-like [Anneissia japonica]|uniref:urotensin-2 receptor-like n=1 Tax=Anneissia japonica TaxID=1529436 RepID=UPI0014255102|nr:urotensin-2 receptor-like [Anneissia japonica]
MAVPHEFAVATAGHHLLSNISSTLVPITEQDYTSPNNISYNSNGHVWNIISWTAFCVIFVVGVTGNCFVLCMTCRPSSRLSISTINTYVMNLAAADLIYVLQYLFFTIGNHLPSGWPFGMIGCKVIISLDIVVMFVGAYILVAMSIERFVAIVFPMQSLQCRSLPCSRWVCGSLWVIGVVAVGIPYAFHYENFFYEEEVRWSCIWSHSLKAFQKYMLGICVTVLIVPSIMLLVVYSSLLIHFWRTVGQVGASLNKNLRRSKRRVVTVVFLIVLAFWICYIPFWTWMMIANYTDYENNVIGLSTVILSYTNSCVNPLLYTLLTNKFNRWRESKKSSRSTSKIALRSI